MAESKLHENSKKLQVLCEIIAFVINSIRPPLQFPDRYHAVGQLTELECHFFTVFFFFWQGINLKTTEMQDTARSFSSMAKEVLRIAEHDKKSS